MRRYIEVQLVMLSPICPHITESVWRKLMGKKTFCVDAKWPTAKEEDVVKTHQFASLQKTAHEFRNQYNKEEKDRKRKLKKAKNGSEREQALSRGFNGATVCVADDYKDYHKRVLEILFAIYDEINNELTEENYKSYLLRNIGVGGGGDDEKESGGGGGGKKKKKKAKLTQTQQAQLQFAAYIVKEVMPERGKAAFNLTLPYDEFQFLQRNLKMLFHEIQIDLAKVTFYKESAAETPKELKGEANPGRPSVKFCFVE